MHRFFVHATQIKGKNIYITGNDVNHIQNVLRLQVGDEIEVCDGEKNDYKCKIEALTKSEIQCTIQSQELSRTELPVEIHLIQGLPKNDKMELIVQKSVELGVHKIIPVEMRRSIVKYDKKKASKKVARWQMIAESAGKQSKRGVIPIVDEVMPFTTWLARLNEYDMILVPYENARGMKATRECLQNVKKNHRICMIIGPEGGFDDKEIEVLRENNANIITLGHRILRTETAGMSMLSMLSYEIEED